MSRKTVFKYKFPRTFWPESRTLISKWRKVVIGWRIMSARLAVPVRFCHFLDQTDEVMNWFYTNQDVICINKQKNNVLSWLKNIIVLFYRIFWLWRWFGSGRKLQRECVVVVWRQQQYACQESVKTTMKVCMKDFSRQFSFHSVKRGKSCSSIVKIASHRSR